MNTGSTPAWMKTAKILQIAKKAGSVCTLQESRSIQLLNHCFKIMEKVTNKNVVTSGVFTTGSYQAGFKIGGSCGYDQTRLLAEINKEMRKRKKNKKLYTLLDITTAFDSVKRPKLWTILDALIDAKRAAALAKFANRGIAEIALDDLAA
jgi:hypothetical protein